MGKRVIHENYLRCLTEIHAYRRTARPTPAGVCLHCTKARGSQENVECIMTPLYIMTDPSKTLAHPIVPYPIPTKKLAKAISPPNPHVCG